MLGMGTRWPDSGRRVAVVAVERFVGVRRVALPAEFGRVVVGRFVVAAATEAVAGTDYSSIVIAWEVDRWTLADSVPGTVPDAVVEVGIESVAPVESAQMDHTRLAASAAGLEQSSLGHRKDWMTHRLAS